MHNKIKAVVQQDGRLYNQAPKGIRKNGLVQM